MLILILWIVCVCEGKQPWTFLGLHSIPAGTFFITQIQDIFHCFSFEKMVQHKHMATEDLVLLGTCL
jgi:hypothetical protein